MNSITLSIRNIYYFKRTYKCTHIYIYNYIYIFTIINIYIQYPPINKIFPRVQILRRFLK